jgi:hypothetical protein
MAKLAEEAERYDDMVQNVKLLAEMNEQLNVEVRDPRGAAHRSKPLPTFSATPC